MSEQVRDKRWHPFIFAKQIANAHEDNFTATDFINSHEWLVRRRGDQSLRAFQFNLIETKDSAMQILRRFVR